MKNPLSSIDFSDPADVRASAAPVLAHRLVLDSKVRHSGAEIIAELLDSVAVPR